MYILQRVHNRTFIIKLKKSRLNKDNYLRKKPLDEIRMKDESHVEEWGYHSYEFVSFLRKTKLKKKLEMKKL